MTYHRTLGAIDSRVGEGGSGVSSGSGAAAGGRTRSPFAITQVLTGGRPRATVPAQVVLPMPTQVRPPGFEPRPVNPTGVVITPTPGVSALPGFGPKPVISGGGGGGGGGGGKGGRVLEIDPIDLEVTPTVDAPAAKSRLGLYLLLGAGAVVGFKLLRKRK